MRRIFFCLLILYLLFGGINPAWAVFSKKAEQLYDEGAAVVNLPVNPGDSDDTLAKLGEAKAKLAEALKLDPQNSKVKEKLELAANVLEFYKLRKEIRALVKEYRWDEAETSLAQITKFAVRPEEKEIAKRLQQYISEQKKAPQAQGEVGYLFKQGQASIEQQDWLTAISQFTKILMLEPENRKAQELNNLSKGGYYYQKGMLALKICDYKEAEKNFRNAVSANPRQADAQKQLDLLVKNQKEGDVQALLREGDSNFKAGYIIGARRNYMAVLVVDPKNTAAAAKIKELEALPAKTEKEIINTVKTPVNLIILLIGIAGLYLFIAKVLRPGSVIEHYRKLKEFDNARLVYESILEKDSNRRVVYAPLTGLYLKLKNHAGVNFLVKQCQQKLAGPNRPDLPLWHLCLGEMYRESGQFHEAQEEMEYAYEQSPHNPEILHKLAALYEHLLEGDPNNDELKLRLKRINTAKSYAPVPVRSDMPVIGDSGIQEPAPTPASNDEHALQVLRECFKRPNT